jgi:hypothetical protein
MYHSTKEQTMQVLETLSCRLKLGGAWYSRGDVVQMDESDAEVYRLRGLSSPAPAGAIARNVTVVPASRVGLVTKAEAAPEGEAEEAPNAATVEVAPKVVTETVKVQGHGKRNR